MPLVGSGNSFGGISGSNATARLLVVISGTSAPLTAAIAQATGSMEAFQANANTLGSALTRSLTLPLAAIGGAAIAAASNFENLMARIAGLTPIADTFKGGIEGIRTALLDIAADPQVIAAPADLAESLYFAGSAGLSAAEAMDVVKLSAQGASIGMGQAADISQVLIFALNNYRSTGLTAADAMDTLTAAIREGTAAPDELAVSLGRLLPIASKAGITFQQVVASVSALTNLGVPTRVATTSLRALFSQLLSPTIQATQLLDQLGLSAERLRDALKLGPVAAFALLEEATKGNTDQMHDLIPQVRALTAYYGTSGTNAERYRQILDAVNHSQGAFKKSLDAISKTPGFKFQKSLQELQVAAIELGTKLFPVFRAIAAVVSETAQAFSELPGPVQSGIAALLVLGAAMGPVLKLYAALTQTVTTGSGAMQFQSLSLKALASNFILAGVAAGVAFTAFNKIKMGTGSMIDQFVLLGASFVAARQGLIAIQGALSKMKSASVLTGWLSGFTQLSSLQLTAVAGGISLVGVAIAFASERANRAEVQLNQFGEALYNAASSGDTLRHALDSIDSEVLRNNLAAIGRDLKVLDVPLDKGIFSLQPEAANRLQQAVTELTNMDFGESAGADQIKDLTKFVPLIDQAASSGKSLSRVFEEGGLSADEFFSILDSVQVKDGLGNMGSLSEGIYAAVGSFQKLNQVRRDMAAQTAAGLTLNTMETASVEDLAKEYGVSVPYMQEKLDALGATATGVIGGDLQDNFAEASFGVDQFGNTVAGSAAEAQDAIAQMATDMADSLQGTAGLFDEFPEKVKGSTREIIKHAEAMSRIAVQQTADIQTLAARGVPTGLINELINQGPNMLNKFANASKSELDGIVTAYEVRLGAMDAAILQEAQHQETKGKNMVAGFAQAILGSKSISNKAAQGIIAGVVQNLNTGRINAKGVEAATLFARGLGRAKGLSHKQATAAMQAFAQGIAQGGLDNKGRLAVQQLANGISQGAHIPIGQARTLVNQVANAIDSGRGKVKTSGQQLSISAQSGMKGQDDSITAIGRGMANALANGITSGIPMAVAAARQLAAATKTAMDQANKNSPEYFTYYMGRKLTDDLYRGMKDAEKLHPGRPSVSMPKVSKEQGHESLARAIAAGVRHGQGPLIVQIDGREVARATRRHQERQRA